MSKLIKITILGNSFGTGLSNAFSSPQQFSNNPFWWVRLQNELEVFGHYVTIDNYSQGGITTPEIITNTMPTAISARDGFADINFAILMEGTNDLTKQVNGVYQPFTDIYRHIKQASNTLRANNFVTIVTTICPRQENGLRPDFEDQRVKVNDLIRSNYKAFANGVADIGGTAPIGTFSALSQPGIWFGDGIHPAQRGYECLQACILNVILPYIY